LAEKLVGGSKREGSGSDMVVIALSNFTQEKSEAAN